MQHLNKVLGKEAELYYELPNGRIKCTACARIAQKNSIKVVPGRHRPQKG